MAIDIGIPGTSGQFSSKANRGKWVVVGFENSSSDLRLLDSSISGIAPGRSDLKLLLSVRGEEATPFSPSRWNVVYETTENLGLRYGVVNRPSFFVIDPDGNLALNTSSIKQVEQLLSMNPQTTRHAV